MGIKKKYFELRLGKISKFSQLNTYISGQQVQTETEIQMHPSCWIWDWMPFVTGSVNNFYRQNQDDSYSKLHSSLQ